VPYAEALEKKLITEIDPFNDYIDSILSLVDIEAIKNARLKNRAGPHVRRGPHEPADHPAHRTLRGGGHP
jgi:phosphoglucomutase